MSAVPTCTPLARTSSARSPSSARTRFESLSTAAGTAASSGARSARANRTSAADGADASQLEGEAGRAAG